MVRADDADGHLANAGPVIDELIEVIGLVNTVPVGFVIGLAVVAVEPVLLALRPRDRPIVNRVGNHGLRLKRAQGQKPEATNPKSGAGKFHDTLLQKALLFPKPKKVKTAFRT